MRPSLVAQSPGSGGSVRAVRRARSRLGLVTVPLGPRSLRSGLRKPGSWSSRPSSDSSPAGAREGERVRRVAQPDDERRAAAGRRRLRAAGDRQVAGRQPAGVGGDAKRDAQLGPARGQHGGAVAQRARPGRGGELRGERWASRTRGSKATARAGIGGQAREALVEGRPRVARRGLPRAVEGSLEVRGARRDDDDTVTRRGRRAAAADAAPARRSRRPARPCRRPAPRRRGRRTSAWTWSAVEGAVGDARSQLLDGQRDERLARVEVEDDVRRAGGHVGERLGPRRLPDAAVVTAAQQHDERRHPREKRERGGEQRGAAAEHRRHGSADPALP